MVKEKEYWSKVIEREFHKPPVMTDKDNEDFKNYTKCWIFKRAYEQSEVENIEGLRIKNLI